MMTKISILLCVIICLAGCTKDNENTNPIIGTWNLIQIQGGLAGSTQNFNSGDKVWTFDEDILTVEDNLANSEDEYQYSIIEHENSLFMDFNEEESIFGEYFFYTEINGDEMMINQGSARIIIQNDTIPTGIFDGFVYSFEKQ